MIDVLRCFLLIFVKINLLVAQQAPNTSSNQSNSPSSLQPRFPDVGAMGLPNFGSGRFGNPTSNYRPNSFFPFGNQNNNNMQQPQQGYAFNPNPGNYQNRPIQGYPNQQGYPYNGMNPNYQRPQYPKQNRPIGGGFSNYPYQGGNSNGYPNYQRPTYSGTPDDGSLMYPDELNGPFQNGMPSNQGGYNQPGFPDSIQFPSQGNQYPYQGRLPGNGNPNTQPDDLNNFPNTNTQFPNNPYQYQPNQYYPQTNLPNPNYNPSQPGSFQTYPPNTSIQFPTNNQPSVNVNPAIQYPGQGSRVQNPAIFSNAPPVSNPENISNDTNPVAILGKPVIVPPSTTPPGPAVIDKSTADDATKKQCVQDCPTTSEYSPVCGTNNITYINPGKFNCAQKCGVAVYLKQRGRCPGDIIPNHLQQ